MNTATESESAVLRKDGKPNGRYQTYAEGRIKRGTITKSHWPAVVRRRMWMLRSRAQSVGVPFDLQPEDIEAPDVCPVLGIPLKKTGGRLTFDSPSVDRIIPEKGYVTGNVVVISQRANRLKNNATIRDLVKLHDFYTKLTGYYHTS